MLYVKTDYQQIPGNLYRKTYLTAGRLYPAEPCEYFDDTYYIQDDTGKWISVIINNKPSHHLNSVGVFELERI